MDLYEAISNSIKRYDFDLVQRLLYTYDVSNIPSILRRFVKVPDVVVQPESVDEVLKILKIAEEFKVPIVPRGAATSAYGGVIPLQGGIVVDFTRMNRFEISKDEKSAIAECGAIWWDIERGANRFGLALRVYPTSAPASTVGGWIAQNGYGVGSLKYGCVGENLEWIEVVDFKGVKRISGRDLRYYIGLNGTTGLIVKACIKLRENRCIRCFAIRSNLLSFDLGNAYHAVFMNREFLKLLNSCFEDVLLLCFEDETDFDGDEKLGKILWDLRFQQLRARREFEIVLSEVVIPYNSIEAFYDEISKMGIALEVVFAKDCAVVFAIIPIRNRFEYYPAILKALKIVSKAEEFGGRPYTTGTFFSHKSHIVYRNFEELLRFKRSVDPQNLLNPGKVFNKNPISRIVEIAERLIA